MARKPVKTTTTTAPEADLNMPVTGEALTSIDTGATAADAGVVPPADAAPIFVGIDLAADEHAPAHPAAEVNTPAPEPLIMPEPVAVAVDADGAVEAIVPTGPAYIEPLPAADALPETVTVADLPATVSEVLPGDLPDADLMVVCHRPGGRRRAGRRWAEGQTPMLEEELTAYQLDQLRGDPQFTVFSIEKA